MDELNNSKDIYENDVDDSLSNSSNLLEEIENTEEEYLPLEEEKNDAVEINIATIFGVIFIALFVIILIIVLLGGKKTKNKTQKELDKAGRKYEMEFTTKDKETFEDDFFQYDKKEEVVEEDIDSILESLPENLKVQEFKSQGTPSVAPVSPVGSTSYNSSKSERPDTRNSKSPRKIEGLKGQASPNTNQNIISAVMNNNGAFSQNQTMTKDEYIAQMMRQTQSLQNQVYGGNSALSSYGNPSSSADAYQQNREQFYSNNSNTDGSGQFLSYNSLWDGTIISAALITAINTDNPGVVIARVTENVYSSYDHSFLLIPEGSLLYAVYNSSISYGQNKVQVAWNLLIRPDGYRISLGNMQGVNSKGEAGYKGRVNNHPWETLKALGLIAVYSLIQTEVSNTIKSTNNEYLQNTMTDVYAQASNMGNRIIDRALDIKPTITIKAGTEIKLITNTPLELPPVKVNQATKKYTRTR